MHSNFQHRTYLYIQYTCKYFIFKVQIFVSKDLSNKNVQDIFNIYIYVLKVKIFVFKDQNKNIQLDTCPSIDTFISMLFHTSRQMYWKIFTATLLATLLYTLSREIVKLTRTHALNLARSSLLASTWHSCDTKQERLMSCRCDWRQCEIKCERVIAIRG